MVHVEAEACLDSNTIALSTRTDATHLPAAFLILILQYFNWVLEARSGYNIGPEVGLDLMVLFHFVAFIPFYGAFILIEYALSRLNSEILRPQFLLTASLATGAIVSYTFLFDLDFLFWLVYQKGAGTIFLSVIAVELLFLLMNYAVVWRIVNGSATRRQIRIGIFVLAALLLGIVYSLQLLL
jgi:hypothetical protein